MANDKPIPLDLADLRSAADRLVTQEKHSAAARLRAAADELERLRGAAALGAKALEDGEAAILALGTAPPPDSPLAEIRAMATTIRAVEAHLTVDLCFRGAAVEADSARYEHEGALIGDARNTMASARRSTLRTAAWALLALELQGTGPSGEKGEG